MADDGASAAVLARYAEDARIRTVSVRDNGLGPAIDAAAAAATGPPASTGSWASPTSPGSATASRWPR